MRLLLLTKGNTNGIVLTEIYVIMRRYIIRRDVLEVFTLHLGFSFLWNKSNHVLQRPYTPTFSRRV